MTCFGQWNTDGSHSAPLLDPGLKRHCVILLISLRAPNLYHEKTSQIADTPSSWAQEWKYGEQNPLSQCQPQLPHRYMAKKEILIVICHWVWGWLVIRYYGDNSWLIHSPYGKNIEEWIAIIMSFLEALILDQVFETKLLLEHVYGPSTKKLDCLPPESFPCDSIFIYPVSGVGTLSSFCSSFGKFII